MSTTEEAPKKLTVNEASLIVGDKLKTSDKLVEISENKLKVLKNSIEKSDNDISRTNSSEKNVIDDKCSDKESKNKKKRSPCPWQLHPPPQPFKKARYAWQIKNYEHTVARMKTAVDLEKEQRQQGQSSSSQSNCNSTSRNNSDFTGTGHNNIPSYAGMYNNIPGGYPANFYNPLFRWSKLAAAPVENMPMNRVLQSILFSGNEQPAPDIHPLLMLSLAENNNSEEHSHANNLHSSVLSSQMTGVHGGSSPVGMHSPPTSEYDSSSDDTSLGEDFIPEQSMMQQSLQYQQLQQYHQQHFNGLIQQHNANAAATLCKRLQQQMQSSDEQDSNFIFQNAMMNCGLGGLQNRHLLNLQLQNLCERMQVDRNLLPLSSYPNFPPMNSPQISDFVDENRAFSGLDSFRRNTPSETESDHTQTTVPLVSNSSVATDETRTESRASEVNAVDCLIKEKDVSNFDHPDISEDSETELSLSEDSGSDIGAVDASDLSEREEDLIEPLLKKNIKSLVQSDEDKRVDCDVNDNMKINNQSETFNSDKNVSKDVMKDLNSEPLVNSKSEENQRCCSQSSPIDEINRQNVKNEPTSTIGISSANNIRDDRLLDCYRNGCDEEDCNTLTKNTKDLDDVNLDKEITPQEVVSPTNAAESQLTTVLTCNCLIAKERSSPSSVSSTKSFEESSAVGSPPSNIDCRECSLHHEETVSNLRNNVGNDKDKCASVRSGERANHICDNNNDKYFFDQAFHLSLKQDLGFQKA